MQPIMVLTATLDAEGKIGLSIQGPVSENELIVLGLLKKVEKAVEQAFAQKQAEAAGAPVLLVANGSLPRNGR